MPPLKYGNPKGQPTAPYKVVRPVLNLHINGVQVAEGQVLTLTEAAARHWLREGVIEAVAATAPSFLPAPAAPETAA
jgi:transposase